MADGANPFIIDNRETDVTDKVQGYLQKWCEVSRQFDIATGYFDIGALVRLDGEWQKLEKIRILMGKDVAKVTHEALIRGITDRLTTSFEEERERNGNEFLSGVPAIVEAIRSGQIECRVYTRGKFHAKMYITHSKFDIVNPVALVGSSNFTVPGISQNIELNVRIEDSGRVGQLQDWFEHFWAHDETVPISEEVLEVMETQAKEYEPFLLYGRSLEEYFRDKGTTGPSVWHEQESIVWGLLDKYQQEGYSAMMRIAAEWGGAFLSDGVGLGKTYVGLMLIERLAVHDGKNVMLLTPKSAHEAVWEPELKSKLPHLRGWGSNFIHKKHTDLNKTSEIDEWEMAAEKFDCIIIDEAHHFRNDSSQRYERLAQFIQSGRRPKQVFFLTATPINNSVLDLKHMIELFTGGNEQHFSRPPLGLHSVYGHFRKLRSALRDVLEIDAFSSVDLAGELTKASALALLRQDPLIRELVVQRSRGYVRESQLLHGGRDIQFPEPAPPKAWNYNLRAVYGELLDEFEQAFNEEGEFLHLSIYYPYQYFRGDPTTIEGIDFKEGRLRQIVRLVRIGMLKAFESSVFAFEVRCTRMLLKLLAWIEHEHNLLDDELRKRVSLWKSENSDILDYCLALEQYEHDEDDDGSPDMPNVDKNLWSDDEFVVRDIIEDTYKDLEQLAAFVSSLRHIGTHQDAKLDRLVELISTEAQTSTGKVIVFSEFMTTARYLHRELQKRLPEVVISQVDSQTKTDRTNIVRRFAPYYNGTSSKEIVESGVEEIEILISTDVLAEGLNLQDATRLVNYDIHWNPVRLMQRIGRIDRRLNPACEAAIISAHPERRSDRGTIAHWNFIPPDNLDSLINLFEKVTGKMILISKLLGVQHGHGLTEGQELDELRDFNEGYQGFQSTEERLQLELDRLILEHPEKARIWRRLPFHTLSGHAASTVNGVFFCYRIPAPIEVDGEVTWTTDDHVGESRWFFFDFDEECIIEGAAEMHRMNDVIQCDVEQERNIQAAPEQLLEAKKKVLKHIKNSVLRNLQAPIGTQPRLVTWMAVSRPSF